MTEEDYATILKTLSGNLAEGSKLSSEPSASVNPSIRWERNVTERKQESNEKATAESDGSPLSDSKAKSLVFSFKLDEIAALLYRGSSNLVCTYVNFFLIRVVWHAIVSFSIIMKVSFFNNFVSKFLFCY